MECFNNLNAFRFTHPTTLRWSPFLTQAGKRAKAENVFFISPTLFAPKVKRADERSDDR